MNEMFLTGFFVSLGAIMAIVMIASAVFVLVLLLSIIVDVADAIKARRNDG